MIQINEKLRIIKSDDKNLVIEELKTITSEKNGTRKEWCWCGYYSSLKSALIGVLHKQLFDSAEEEMSVKDLLSRIESVEKEIIDCVGDEKWKKQN